MYICVCVCVYIYIYLFIIMVRAPLCTYLFSALMINSVVIIIWLSPTQIAIVQQICTASAQARSAKNPGKTKKNKRTKFAHPMPKPEMRKKSWENQKKQKKTICRTNAQARHAKNHGKTKKNKKNKFARPMPHPDLQKTSGKPKKTKKINLHSQCPARARTLVLQI